MCRLVNFDFRQIFSLDERQQIIREQISRNPDGIFQLANDNIKSFRRFRRFAERWGTVRKFYSARCNRRFVKIFLQIQFKAINQTFVAEIFNVCRRRKIFVNFQRREFVMCKNFVDRIHVVKAIFETERQQNFFGNFRAEKIFQAVH